MWDFFESKLNQNLANLEANATTVERVRAVLLEAIPSGDCSIERVASDLAMSKRTLQRKLTAEADSFQSILQNVRSELADHYLEKSKLSLGKFHSCWVLTKPIRLFEPIAVGRACHRAVIESKFNKLIKLIITYK